ncbi:hypothetical protein VCHA56P521_20246 [Vibrio chagasii]|nr:hypothetical protein VCHA31O71_20049 [Vibrio chagasii]CAH6894843.1 hypothetical protein VCHA36O163_20578 [Vibrio chagasii]CAH6921149.1 hypothetical protein VCHA36P168_30219 [Vibrio chagasii]CAH7245539.1 hypothetical protein VCHA49P382_20049 [Vibrio chagasii]CAH7280469.1 hypothetical protein VCHA52P461_30219 [Vibrio chagasii]
MGFFVAAIYVTGNTVLTMFDYQTKFNDINLIVKLLVCQSSLTDQ